MHRIKYKNLVLGKSSAASGRQHAHRWPVSVRTLRKFNIKSSQNVRTRKFDQETTFLGAKLRYSPATASF